MKFKFVMASVASVGLILSPAIAAPTTPVATAAVQDMDEDDDGTTGGAGSYIIALGALAAAGLGLYIALDSSNDDDDLPTFVPPAPVSP